MLVAIGNDHGGLELKPAILKHLQTKNIQFVDCGSEPGQEADYPDYAKKVTDLVVQKKCDFGILICGTGVGMSMAANKINGIRAAAVSESFSAKATRAHNNANILCLGARVIGAGVAIELVDIFLNTPFEGGRHERRVAKIHSFESNKL